MSRLFDSEIVQKEIPQEEVFKYTAKRLRELGKAIEGL